MYTTSYKAIWIILIWVALCILVTCESKTEFVGEILATVGDRVITKEDFLRRAEYTIRPNFCASDNYIHRKIVLNSLIAEKLLALETPDSPLSDNNEFKAYIQGRKEQVMRQWLRKEQAQDKASVDTSAQRFAYRMSGRSYRIQFVTLPDNQAVNGWNNAIEDGYDFNTIASALMDSDTIPMRSISWFDREVESIWVALFENDHNVGETIGPLAIDNGQSIVVKIQGWIDSPALTDSEFKLRWSDVGDRLFERQTNQIYREYVSEIMDGKNLLLNRAVFTVYAQRAAEIYLRTAEEKKELLNRAVWNADEQVITEPLGELPEIDGAEKLFEVDSQIWTVDQFELYLKRHPLVFPQKKMSIKEFPEQLKYAIADLVRDHYITEKAYELGYDKVQNIKQSTQLWTDHYVSRQARNDYLRTLLDTLNSNIDLSSTQIIEQYMNPLLDSLQHKYSSLIQINTDMFETLELSSVPMSVSKKNVPFTLSVPAFPRLTTDDRLDYGKKMLTNKE